MVSPQFEFLACLILNSFCKNSNLPSISYDMPAHLRNFCLYVVFVNSSDKLLNYLKLDPEFIEVKMETLKTHKFRPW